MYNDIYSNPKKDSRGKYGEHIIYIHVTPLYPGNTFLHSLVGCMRLHEVKILHIEIATITTWPSVRTPSANGTSTAL